MQALRLIGQGLIAEYHDAGSPIIATAYAAEERLDAVKEIWDRTRVIGRRLRVAGGGAGGREARARSVSERSPA